MRTLTQVRASQLTCGNGHLLNSRAKGASLPPFPKHLRCSMEPGWTTNLRRYLCHPSKTVPMPSGWEPDGNSKTKKAREGS